MTAESGRFVIPRRAVLFGPRNLGDLATEQCQDKLFVPLLAQLMRDKQPDWTLQAIGKVDAVKARLGRLLGGDETPALLFTASHGMGFLQRRRTSAYGSGGARLSGLAGSSGMEWPYLG